MSGNTTPDAPGPFERSIIVFLFGGLAGTALQCALFLRPGPTGNPYVMDLWHYLPHAIFYDWYGLALLTAPFFPVSYLLEKRRKTRVAQLVRGVQIGVTFLSLLVSHIDHEVTRFMGCHISFDFMRAYGRLNALPVAIGDSLADDAGGPFSAWALLLIPISFGVFAVRFNGRRILRFGPLAKRILLACAAFAFYLVGFSMWVLIPGGRLRQDKVKPPTILVYHEIRELLAPKRDYGDIGQKTIRARELWKRGDRFGQWRFTSSDYPFRKQHIGACRPVPDGPWNIVVIQLETFRAKDMKLFNPDLDAIPTPFLDKLGMEEDAAYWPRFFCNGLPTVFTFMAAHTGLLPHTTKRVATAFPAVAMDAIPLFLRRHGYHAVYVTGSDPDWDNQRRWCSKWYDRLIFDPDFEERDRDVFRAAARYLKDHKWGDRPFFAAVVSISNHIPFRSRDPNLEFRPGNTVFEKLHNSMRYTDDAVREFFESIRDEPWFEKTVFVITGDHGYDLGDRGDMLGFANLRAESTWVPFIIKGRHPLLPRGRQEVTASHIDLAPTVMTLAGICDDNSFMGHTLIEAEPGAGYALTVRDNTLAYSSDRYTAYLPHLSEPMLYGADDPLHQTDIAADHKADIQEAVRNARNFVDLTDFLYENNRIAPPSNVR